MKPYSSAVVFDLDGTLVDSRDDLVAAVSWVLDKLGHPARPAEEIVSFVGHGVRQLVRHSLPESVTDDPAVEEALRLFRGRYGEHLADETRAYPGVVAALQELADRGVPAWVLTNKPGPMARAVVEALGLAPLLGGVLGADDVSVHKPDPAGLIGVCAGLGLAPSAVWYVGDMALDVRTAAAAGCKSALAVWGYRGKAPLREVNPDIVLESPADIMGLD